MADAPSPAKPELLATQAAVSWLSADGSLQYLCHSDPDPSRQVTFDIFSDVASAAALFRVRAPIAFKACPNEKTPTYLYVYADRVESLSRGSPGEIPEEIRQRLGEQLTCLRLGLNKPADLIVPQIPLVPAKRKGHGDRLDAVKLLAQATSWVVYLAAGSSTLDALLDKLCVVVAGRGLRLLPVAAPSGLYSGKGGKILGGSDLAATQLSPPSYDEIEPSPPSDERAASSGAVPSGHLKRRREHHDADIEATCTGIVERIMTKYRDEDRKLLRSEVQEIRGELKELKKEMFAYIDQRVQELEDKLGPDHIYTRGEVDEEIERVRNYNDDMIDVKLDDCIDGVKVELQEYVDDQFEAVEGRMIERLRTANVVLDIAD